MHRLSQSAYIKLVKGSAIAEVSLDDIKEQFGRYREQLAKTGQQLDWNYADNAFPYTIQQKPEGEGKWFYLKGTQPSYRYIVIGVGSSSSPDAAGQEGEEAAAAEPFVQVVLPEGSTVGDKAKGNELTKYLGKTWKAEVRLFNGRVMYFNPRK